MPTTTLTIDGRTVSVETGTTVVEAARALGIRIPTLCNVDGLPPSSSCFLCAVQVEGKAALAPSCAMPAGDGMVVYTDTDEIRASRKMALELLLSDHAGDCIGPCMTGCPASFDIPGFLTEVAAGRDRTRRAGRPWPATGPPVQRKRGYATDASRPSPRMSRALRS